jgi:hypothetical protein
MEIKFFSDLIDALGKVVDGLKALARLPKAERDKFREIIDETCRLLDTTLNMVIIKLGDISQETTDSIFLDEVARLDNYADWMTAEREFRLCRSLRAAVREATTARGRLIGAIVANDWNTLLTRMEAVLATEGEIANFVGGKFSTLAGRARGQKSNIGNLRDDLAATRAALIAERQRLIRRELDLMSLA